jgi:hypothetical protein
MNSNTFDSTFWLSITTLIVSFLSGAIIFCLKSKCKDCNICFGLIRVSRDVELEVEEEKHEIEAGIDPYSMNNINKK